MFNLEDGKAIATKKRHGKKGKKEKDSEKREAEQDGRMGIQLTQPPKEHRPALICLEE